MLEVRADISPELVLELSSLLKKEKTVWSKKQLIYLINLTCMNSNLLNYQSFETRHVHEECVSTVIQLLGKECARGEETAYGVVGLFLKHQVEHPGCYVSLEIFWKVMVASPNVVNVIRKEYMDAVGGLIEATWDKLDEAGKFKLLERNKFQVHQGDVIQKAINEMSSLPKPTRRQERQKTEVSGKVPPLIVPTVNTITSSRFDLNETGGTALLELEKLAGSLGEAAVGIELGTLTNKRRSQQVQLFEESEDYRRSLEENSVERDILATPRDLAMTEAESQRDSVLSPTNPKDLKKCIVALCNILYKIISKDQQSGVYQAKYSWLPKIFEILLSGTFSNFNREIVYRKPQDGFFGKQVIFSKLLNLSGLYSQQVHLNIILMKNLHQPEGNSESPTIEITDQLLKTIKVEKKKINKKIVQKLGLTNMDTEELIALKQNLNQFLALWKTNFLKVINCYSLTGGTLFELETNLLNILANYLKHTESRISTYEVIQQVFDILLFVKRQILQLSLPFLNQKMVSSPSLSQGNFHKKQSKDQYFSPLIYTHKELVGAFLSVIANFSASNRFVQRLVNNCFMRCEPFVEILKVYGKELFRLENYDLILKLLAYYRRMIIVFNERYIKNKDMKPIRAIFKSVVYLLVPRNGEISSYLQANENSIATLLRTRHTLNKEESRALVFFSQLVRFCETVFQYPVVINPVLEEDSIVSFYIRFSFLNFVRLYSFLTERELKSLREQQVLKSPHLNSNTHFNQMLLKRLLGLIKSLASSRTQEMSRKFVHYKVLEFFVRELQLEYDIGQYPRRNRKRKQGNPSSNTGTGFSLNLNLNFSGEKSLKSQEYEKMEKSQKSQKSEKSQKSSKPQGPRKTPIVPILPLPNQIVKSQTDNIEDMPTKKGIPMLKIAGLRNNESPLSSYKQDEGELGPIIAQINNKYECSNKPAKKIPGLAPLKLSKLEKLQSEPHSNNMNTEPKSSSDFNLSYVHERRMRKLYSSKTLHSQIILLVFNLLLKKGLLDPIYCSQEAINQDKMNILSILHAHLNHPSNRHILPILAQGVRSIQCYPSGQRLLKLLSYSFTNTNVYGERNKLTSNGGSKCAIISCKTKLQEPKEVVIKELSLSNDRYSCRLTNIFNEITCLDNFRLQPKITTLYDFGVTQYCYVIIMKKYKTSLRSWRRQLLDKKLQSILSLLLKIFKQVCVIVKLLHDQNVTHYDIKCDNVLLDYQNQQDIEQGKFNIVFADFGCCKMYENEKDEFDLMHRGTEVAMSPEMLDIASKNKKQADDFDRRKKVGTTRAADIWSLGCLFFELMTGEYLFKNGVWGRVNRPVGDKGDILVKEDLEMLHGNIYLIDFLRFMLNRDPQMRPNINSVIARFEHIESILGEDQMKPYFQYTSPLRLNETLEGLLDSYLLEFDRDKQKEKEKDKKQKQKSLSLFDPPKSSNRGLQKIMKDIYICDDQFAKNNTEKIASEGITHVVATSQISKFNTLVIKPGKESSISLALRLSPRLSDLIREVIMFKGKVLFVNNKQNFAVGVLIYTLSIWFKCSIYETWCLINTQILQFPFPDDFLPRLSTAFTKFQKIDQYIQNLPKLQCVCCSVTMILPRPLPDIKHDSLTCKCTTKKQGCPSGRCLSYLEFLKRKFKIEWEQLIWRKVPQNCFLVGPFKSGQVKDSFRSQILINSADSNQNLVEVNSSDSKEWRLYRCKVCEMWMLARHKSGDMMIISNTHIKSFKQGIMIPNAQQGYKAKAPLLNEYTLSKLHLIEA